VLSNVAGVRLRGVEVEGNYVTPIENLVLTFSGSYNDGIYSDFTNAPCASDYYSTTGKCNFTGRQMSGSSRWIGNIGFVYSHPAFTGYTAYFWGNESYKSETNLSTTLDAYGIQKGYSLVNTGIGIRPNSKSWEAELWGKNILDTHYYTFITQASATTAVTGASGDPLTFGVTYRQKF
jgi:iron complex outermembrane receptor protein